MRRSRVGEEALGIVVGLGLHVLAEGQRHRAAFGRVGQHGHRPLQRRHDLLGPGDAVEVARDRAEAVVGRDRAVAEILDLLQHRVGAAVGEDVARQQQHRQAVDMGERRAAVTMLVAPGPIEVVQAIMRAAPHRLGIGDGAMGHGLLVVGAEGRQASSRAPCSASPMPATLPWPKIAQMPANSGSVSPSISVICAPR